MTTLEKLPPAEDEHSHSHEQAYMYACSGFDESMTDCPSHRTLCMTCVYFRGTSCEYPLVRCAYEHY